MKRTLIGLALTTSMLLPIPARAQEISAADIEWELRRMVAEPTEADHDREVVRDFLERDDVAEVASAHGVDVDRLKDGVQTLGVEESAALAQRVRDIQDQSPLVGGDTFVITSTTVIIILLVIILIKVA